MSQTFDKRRQVDRAQSDISSKRSSARCYALAKSKQSATYVLHYHLPLFDPQHQKPPKHLLAATHLYDVYSLRTIPLHERHACPTLDCRRAFNGRQPTRHHLRLRRPARAYGTLHRSIRRLHRQRPQTGPGGTKPVPHQCRRATR